MASNTHNPFYPVGQPNTAAPPAAAPTTPPAQGVFGNILPPQTANPSGYASWSNNTGDPRVVFDGGNCAMDEVIIYAKDFPANTGMGRSRTRKDPMDASKASIEMIYTPVGAGSANDFIKVRLSELKLRPVGVPQVKTGPQYGRPAPKPMVASGNGSVPKGTLIPDAHFPDMCGQCGSWYYQGTKEHPTPDGRCPGGKPTRAKP